MRCRNVKCKGMAWIVILAVGSLVLISTGLAFAAWTTVGVGIEYEHVVLSDPNHVYVARMLRSQVAATIESSLPQGKLTGAKETVKLQSARLDDAINWWGKSWGKRNDVVVAINGDWTDLSNGIMYGGQVHSGWFAKGMYCEFGGKQFAWTHSRVPFVGGALMTGVAENLSVTANGAVQTANGVNRARRTNELIIFTPQYDSDTNTDSSGVEVLVEMVAPSQITPVPGVTTGHVREIRASLGSTPIPFDHVVLSASGTAATTLLRNISIGAEVGISQQVDLGEAPHFNWADSYASVRGGRLLVKSGAVVDNTLSGDAFYTTRQPRTAVGYNDTYVFFVVCDGRSTASLGMTALALSNFFKNTLGATYAMDLDSGGSSTMVLNGTVQNVPSDGSERAVGNGLMMVNILPKGESSVYSPGQSVVTTGSANLRLGPGTNYLPRTVLPVGSVGTVVDHSLKGVYAKGGYWWKVSFAGLVGWVSESLLVPHGTDTAPTVTEITPGSALNTGSVSIIDLAGTGFASGATVKLTKLGHSDIVATGVVVASSSKITCTFALAGKAVGAWSVVVTNPDAQFGTLENGFVVNTPSLPPAVTAITPGSALNTGSVSITDLVGTGFVSGATVKLTKSGQSDIEATDVVVVSSTKITCTFALTGKAVGAWSVVVTNSDGQFGVMTNGFNVTVPAPTLTGITPASALNTVSVNITDLAGTGFAPDLTVKLTRLGESDNVATDVSVVSSSKVTCTFDLIGKATGEWSVVVTNADAQTAALTNGFTVVLPAPAVTSVAPESAANTGSVNITDLGGTGFVSGATVKLAKSGQSDIAATDVTVVSSSKITCAFNLTGAAEGAWNVVVTNSDGQFGLLMNGFAVNDGIHPSVSINKVAGQSDPTNASPINFTVVFSEAVTGFDTGDVTLGGTAGASTVAVTGTGARYNVAVSGMAKSGTVTASISGGVADNAAGHANTGSTSTDNTVAYDIEAPTIGMTFPTTATTFMRNGIPLRLNGTAVDGVSGVAVVKYSVNGGAATECDGKAFWDTSYFSLDSGDNVVTITATDGVGNTATLNLAVKVVDSSPGTAWSGLAMVSLPIIPDISDSKAVVGFVDNLWYWWRIDAGDYMPYSVSENASWFVPRYATPGRAFWAQFDSEPSSPIGMVPPQDKTIRIRLGAGWNMIGTPFTSPVPWNLDNIQVDTGSTTMSLAAAKDTVNNWCWGWDNIKNEYYLVYDTNLLTDAHGEILPWLGYWIKANVICDLVLPAP